MKKYKLLFIMIMFILLPFNVNASTKAININCSSKNIKSGEEVTCTISGNTDVTITAVEANITTSTNLQLLSNSLNLNSEWSNGTITDSKINVSTSSKNMNFTIGSFNIKANDNAENGETTVGLSSVYFIDENNNRVEVSNASFTITISNDEQKKNGLSNLTITGGELSPLFSETKKDYTVKIENDSFSINATKANSDDSIKIINTDNNQEIAASNITFSPKIGSTIMSIKIEVGTGDNMVTYTLLVSKKQTSSDNKYLSSLTIGGKSITLIDGKYDYEITLDDLSSFTVKAVVLDSSKYSIEDINGNTDNSGTYQRTWNESPVSLIIKPKTSGINGVTYIININKSNNSNIDNSSNNGNSNNNNPSNGNPQTGNISIFVITLILIASLIISLNMYKKNIENYN